MATAMTTAKKMNFIILMFFLDVVARAVELLLNKNFSHKCLGFSLIVLSFIVSVPFQKLRTHFKTLPFTREEIYRLTKLIFILRALRIVPTQSIN